MAAYNPNPDPYNPNPVIKKDMCNIGFQVCTHHKYCLKSSLNVKLSDNLMKSQELNGKYELKKLNTYPIIPYYQHTTNDLYLFWDYYLGAWKFWYTMEQKGGRFGPGYYYNGNYEITSW